MTSSRNLHESGC